MALRPIKITHLASVETVIPVELTDAQYLCVSTPECSHMFEDPNCGKTISLKTLELSEIESEIEEIHEFTPMYIPSIHLN